MIEGIYSHMVIGLVQREEVVVVIPKFYHGSTIFPLTLTNMYF